MADHRIEFDRADEASYAGRWVARLRGRIIAQGGTPELARRAAGAARHKERPEIVFMPSPVTFPPVLEKVKAALDEQQSIHLVGGAVRDALLGRESHDFDFAVLADGVQTARRVARALDGDLMVLDEQRDTGRAIVTDAAGQRVFLDFAVYRAGADLEADLRGRDLTVNAIAYDVRAATILDPLDGAADLRARKLRAVSASAFRDDPVRILRAVRLAASLDFKIEPKTRAAMKEAVGLLARVAAERVRDELFKILDGPKAESGVRALELLGSFPHVLPELTALAGVAQSAPHVFDVWTHTLAVLEYLDGILDSALDVAARPSRKDPFLPALSERLHPYAGRFVDHFSTALNADRTIRGLLFFSALYHDVAKPQTRAADETGRVRFLGHDEQGAQVAVQRAEALHLSNQEIARLQAIVANHMRFHFHSNVMESEGKEPSRRAIYRFFRDSGDAGVDLILLALADLRATRGKTLKPAAWAAALKVAEILLQNYWDKPAETVSPARLLDGDDLMRELNLQAGPLLGKLLEALREAQATGQVGTRADALECARNWLRENPV